jgi:ATP-binding cassette, subfamily B, bacterial
VNGNKDISTINERSLWARLSVLFQDFNRYQLTVKENIGIDTGPDLIQKYSKITGIDKFIKSLPQGYNSILGRLFKGGQDLSGGQWQKVALTRAVLKQGDFLFLDEPTSALDPESEYEIINSLLKTMENRGIVYITHRINVAMLADEIIVMEEGKIAERGNHDDLIKQEGIYFKQYNQQMELLTSKERKTAIYG